MFTICHQIGIKADAQTIYEALSTADGVSAWWSHAEGDFEAGGEIKISFGDTTMTMMILQQNPAKIAWQCVEVNPEWQDTQILFELEEARGETLVHFRHEMWSEESPLYAHCCTKWALYLMSLKSSIENGKGSPYPHDVPVNHNEGRSSD